jgi:hypothetical protein
MAHVWLEIWSSFSPGLKRTQASWTMQYSYVLCETINTIQLIVGLHNSWLDGAGERHTAFSHTAWLWTAHLGNERGLLEDFLACKTHFPTSEGAVETHTPAFEAPADVLGEL